MNPVSVPLRIENTTHVGSVGHRLALGVQWTDALSQSSAAGTWISDLEAIGRRPCRQRFISHPQGRHALLAAGRLSKLLQLAAADKLNSPPPTIDSDPTNFILRAFGRASSRIEAYTTSNDPRQFVPRQLSLTPEQTGGVPAAGLANIRNAWLWPGSAYPLAANTTALRGRIRRGASDLSAKTVAWARIAVTQPGTGPANYPAETKIGFAHGDDRGEFLAVLGAPAVPGGAALPPTIRLRVWVFLPSTDTFDPVDPLASLPLEVAGTDAVNDVLRGTQRPGTYLPMSSIDVTLAPGSILTMDETQLLFV